MNLVEYKAGYAQRLLKKNKEMPLLWQSEFWKRRGIEDLQ